ncbi:MAG: tetratricopeptide repeat protein [Nitrospira sp.]|nr:tetratricopeptide repeat protein [Nitrospira sp.]
MNWSEGITHLFLRRCIVLCSMVVFLAAASGTATSAQQATVNVLLPQVALAYDDRDYTKALLLLDRILTLEPNNARANYYKGLVFLSQEKPELATQALTTAHADDPQDLFIRYHLGQAYFLQKHYDQAEPLLSGVYAEQPKLEHVGFYMGFLQYQRKAYPEALVAFSHVELEKTDPEMRKLVRSYKGLTLANLGRPSEAIKEIDAATEIQAQDSFSRSIQSVRDTLASVRHPGQRFRASLGFGAFYSDNVALNPNRSGDTFAESLRSRSTTSPGLLMSAYGEYAWLRNGPWESTVSYNFFQTVNLNDGLSRFNIQDHQVTGAGYYRGTLKDMPYQVGLSYAYDYLFLGQDGFLSRHTPTLSGTLVESSRHMTTALFRFQDKTFYREPDQSGHFSAFERDAMNWMGGVTHTFRFQEDRYLVSLGYQYDVEDAKGSDFSYSGHRLLVGGLYTFPWGGTRFRYDYQVHWRGYRSLNLAFPSTASGTVRREDTEQMHFARLEQPLPYNFVVSLQYQRIQNDSNLAVYDYAQNIFYLVTTWTY